MHAALLVFSLIVIVIILTISMKVLIIFTDDILVILKPYLYDITVTDLPNWITLNKSNLFFLINKGYQLSLIVHK